MTTPSSISLLSLSIQNKSLLIEFSPWLIGILFLLIIGVILWKHFSGKLRGPNFEIDRAEFGLGSGKISFKPNLGDQQIAYKIWVELSTRKIGLPIDLDHDVISEVYDSWFNFFSITRELIKDIPVNKVKNPSTREVITLSINVLNQGLRPHLTSWQARFRHWYNKELDKSEAGIDPQAIQAKYPRFVELKADLVTVNQRLIKYRDKMKELVLGLSDDESKVVESEPSL